MVSTEKPLFYSVVGDILWVCGIQEGTDFDIAVLKDEIAWIAALESQRIIMKLLICDLHAIWFIAVKIVSVSLSKGVLFVPEET